MTADAAVDVVVVGGGPAGLSAALNLARARTSVLLVDAGRPRNAATLRSHGYLTRDGIPPIELRKLGRAELEAYPNVRIVDRSPVARVTRDDDGFTVTLAGRAATTLPEVRARAVVLATGLRETLPEVPSLRAFYGITVFSCAACDGWDLQDRPLALIGETGDLAARARLLARWTSRLTVFTNGTPAIDAVDEAELAASGITVDRRRIDDLEGDRGHVTAVRLVDGDRVEIDGGFVRPLWDAALDFVAELSPDRDADGHLVTDRSGRTSVAGLYAAGDAASPGPQQLIVAAGQGARVAAVLVHDLVGVRTSH
ncbi:NAD(P)/FAD-dependent oxidoreductase [Microbacterium sp. PRF11]|uniref:NAD(P)/FAD-dependent oxidoreductase n=1 Tax=Microbacterium sp. PRF11 TaxID=2962593 RepID=UPI00288163A7|nr:NAD(P)/FAD-dependent oxidoreductase [Microbacterium sp. PRF11]MDT0116340.1 NAD(P)/FAD-dependent oxidoreductase [Microbacterium sp. PRF11]